MGLLNRESSGVLTAVAAMAAAYVAFTMGFLDPVVAFVAANTRLALGLTVIGTVGWWALDEAEADDDTEEVIAKTSSRAESATRGLFSAGEVTLGGLLAVGYAFGDQLLAMAAGALGSAMGAPLVASNIGALGVAWAGFVGILAANEALTIGIVLLVLALISRRGSD